MEYLSVFAPRKRVHLIEYPAGETPLCGKKSGLHSSYNYRYEGGWEVERYRRGYFGPQIWVKASVDDLVELCSVCLKIAEKQVVINLNILKP